MVRGLRQVGGLEKVQQMKGGGTFCSSAEHKAEHSHRRTSCQWISATLAGVGVKGGIGRHHTRLTSGRTRVRDGYW